MMAEDRRWREHEEQVQRFQTDIEGTSRTTGRAMLIGLVIALVVVVGSGAFALAIFNKTETTLDRAFESFPGGTQEGGGAGGGAAAGAKANASADADAVYEACVNAISDTPAAEAARPACESARDAFRQCTESAKAQSGGVRRQALTTCKSSAETTIAALDGS